ncbi:MAG TPA: hypothetical protein VGO47_03770 [Chlamydiales bacterium]|jgi:hypothetical protein|nr:hypothetical protein [Chlamydiales bacterium]
MTYEEFQERMAIYLKTIPLLAKFERRQAEQIVLDASETSHRTGAPFYSICDNLAFIKCVELRKRFW